MRELKHLYLIVECSVLCIPCLALNAMPAVCNCYHKEVLAGIPVSHGESHPVDASHACSCAGNMSAAESAKLADDLRTAAVWGDLAMVQSILAQPEGRIALTARSSRLELKTPLHCAAAAGQADVMECMLDLPEGRALLEKCDPHNEDCTPLWWAAYQNEADTVEVILRHPEGLASVSGRDSLGQTPLHYAARRGHADAVASMLQWPEGRAVLSMRDQRGRTPMHRAARAVLEDRCADMLACMLRHPEGRAALTMYDSFMSTPMHIAASSGHVVAMARLSDWPEGKAALSMPNSDQHAPLHVAVSTLTISHLASLLQLPHIRAALGVGSSPAQVLQQAASRWSNPAVLYGMLRLPHDVNERMRSFLSSPVRSGIKTSPLLLEASFASCGCFDSGAKLSVSRKPALLKTISDILTQRVYLRISLLPKVRLARLHRCCAACAFVRGSDVCSGSCRRALSYRPHCLQGTDKHAQASRFACHGRSSDPHPDPDPTLAPNPDSTSHYYNPTRIPNPMTDLM